MSSETINSSEAEKQENNNDTKPLRGFAAHPENINRNGAPKKEWTMKSLIEDAGEDETTIVDKDGHLLGKTTYKKAVAKKLWQLGFSGDVSAIREINNRIDGMPLQKQEVTGRVEITFDNSLKQDETQTIQSPSQPTEDSQE